MSIRGNTGVVDSRTGRRSGPIRDPNVKGLVQAWTGYTPSDLDISFAEFLIMPPQDTRAYGLEFARKHQRLIERILGMYAESVGIVGEMAGANQTRDKEPETKVACVKDHGYGYQREEDEEDDDDDDDGEERFNAQEFEYDDRVASYIRKLEIRDKFNRTQPASKECASSNVAPLYSPTARIRPLAPKPYLPTQGVPRNNLSPGTISDEYGDI